jgi:hypothetical protein
MRSVTHSSRVTGRIAFIASVAWAIAGSVDGAIRVATPQDAAPLDLARWIDAYVEGSRALEAGDLAVAQDRLLAAIEFAPRNPQTLHQLAALAARRGESASALELLRRAVVAGLDDAALLEWDPDLESLRAFPEFAAIVAAARTTAPAPTVEFSVPSIESSMNLAVSRDRRLAAFGTRTITIVGFDSSGRGDLGRGRIVAQFSLSRSRATRLAFDAAGSVLGVAISTDHHVAQHGVVLFDIATRRVARNSDGRLGEMPELVEKVTSTGFPSQEIAKLAGFDSVNAIATVPESNAVVALNWTGAIRIVQPGDARAIAAFEPPLVAPGMVVLRDTSTVVLGGRAGALVDVDLATGRERRVLQSSRKRDFTQFMLFEEGTALRARDDIGWFRIDLSNGRCEVLAKLPFKPTVQVRLGCVLDVDRDPAPGFEASRRVEESLTRAVVFGDRLWVGTERSHVYVFDLTTESDPIVIDLADLDQFDTVEVGEIVFAPDGDRVIITSSGLAVAAAYDTATLKRLWQVIYDSGNGAPLQARFSRDGKTLAFFGQGDWTPRIVDAATGVTRLDLAFRGVHFIEPTDDPGLVLADTARGVEAIEVPSGLVRWSRLALRDGSQIERSVQGYVFGSAYALGQIHVLREDGSDDLATLAPYLLDLKKIRAAAAGVAITPPRAPER